MAPHGNCPDGYCGGCPSCLRAQGYIPDEDQDVRECWECGAALDLDEALEGLLAKDDRPLCVNCREEI